MITEDYVSFETAKLLKEKGFYGECMSMYVTPKSHFGMGNPNEAKIAPHGRDSHYYDGYIYQCEAPTLQMAMKWLRKVHNLDIITPPQFDNSKWTYSAIIFKLSIPCTEIRFNDNKNKKEACEAAIKYCLKNLI